MGSQGVGSNGSGATQTHIQTQNSISNPLARQGSLYNLTLDEVQTQLGDLGKPLSSMNLDELLKTVWTAEGNDHTGESSTPVPRQGHLSSLDRQSSINLSQDLSKKTVDEVWQHIQQEQGRSNLDRKATLGEITLEDFLVKAGVVAETVPVTKSSGLVDPVAMTPQAQWMNYQMSPLYMPSHHVVQHPMSLGGNSMMDGSYGDGQMNLSSSPLMGNLSDNQTPGRKRGPGEIAEKSVERRQKRMIKNRESAARSRARKQAYTHELENKVSRLEEENERLRRQKEWEMAALPATPQPAPKLGLRRINSAPI